VVLREVRDPCCRLSSSRVPVLCCVVWRGSMAGEQWSRRSGAVVSSESCRPAESCRQMPLKDIRWTKTLRGEAGFFPGSGSGGPADRAGGSARTRWPWPAATVQHGSDRRGCPVAGSPVLRDREVNHGTGLVDDLEQLGGSLMAARGTCSGAVHGRPQDHLSRGFPGVNRVYPPLKRLPASASQSPVDDIGRHPAVKRLLAR
jgi:hypothetical protein